MEQSYSVAIIQHDKSIKWGPAKLPVEVRQAIDVYLEAVGRTEACLIAPLFVGFRKGDHPRETPISGTSIERAVKQRARAIGLATSLHGMRASFITLAFEGGADLTLV